MTINLSSKIVVGVTLRVDNIVGRSELRDAIDQRLIQWLVQAGCLPFFVPNTLCGVAQLGQPLFDNWLQVVKPGAIILSGGNDIGEYPERDTIEKYLLSWAERKKVPVLGICRGLQMMAVWAGANLAKQEGHVGRRHQLLVSGPKDEWPASVNSYHDDVVCSCPDGFDVVAEAEDGAIEAIKHTRLPWEGWMWHPEREESFAQQDIKRFKRLFCG
jgi:putative glutamine amidotransferase